MNRDEFLKLELSALFEEYRQLKSEIVSMSASRAVTEGEIALIVLDLLGLVYSAFWGFQAELRR
jgi:hypothetical protein